jgi:hypothetical protein
MPDPLTSGDILFFANSGGGTDNQAKLTMGGDGKLYWSLDASEASVAVSGVLSAGQAYIVLLEFNGDSVLNVYIDDLDTPFVSLDPRDDFNGWDSILLGARTAGSENSALSGLGLGAYFHTTDILSAPERAGIQAYWAERFSL